MLTDERTGVVVIRIWLEGPAPADVRIRLTGTRVPPVAEPRAEVASSIEDALALVRDWLEAFVTDP